MTQQSNPFSVTAAVDFTDQEIVRKWVTFSSDGIINIVKPASEMPMLILGGKGSGKTHLMRYLSTSVRIAGGASGAQLLESKYLGSYLRCGGINASRFEGKGRASDEWATVFQYHLDLTLVEILLLDVVKIFELSDVRVMEGEEALACERVIAEFDCWRGNVRPRRIVELAQELASRRRAIDMQVNNCALSRSLNVVIDITPGRLLSLVPKCLAESIHAFRNVRFVYLLDELENLNESQQVYVNSLVRENAPPACIKVGARLYGLRTYRTLSANEELKEGSEYEKLLLDYFIRSKGDPAFLEFATQMCGTRLRDAGVHVPESSSFGSWMISQFEAFPESVFGDDETAIVKDRSVDRPWMKSLRNYLLQLTPELSNEIVELLSVEEHPLVERVAVHVFYQMWHKSGPSLEIAAQISRDAREFVNSNASRPDGFRQTFKHWKADMLAHIYKDHKKPLFLGGFPRLVDLAHGLPRHLLVILKHVYDWSQFREENPFAGGVISTESQRLGVSDAAEWFFHDARMAGLDGERLSGTVSRIGEFLKEIRYSDKPSETGICTFTVNLTELQPETRRMLEMAEKWSLIGHKDGGRPEKNSSRVDEKFRVNPLLCIRWGLSTVIRGDLQIAPKDMDVIVGGTREEYLKFVKERVAGMNGPSFGRKRSGKRGKNLALFQAEDDED